MGFWTNKPKAAESVRDGALRGGRFGRGKNSDDGAVAEQEVWTGKQDLITRGWKVAGVAALLAGPMALGLVATGATVPDPEPAKAPVPVTDTHAESQAGELARQLTIAWLEAKRGDEKALAAWVDVPSSLPSEPLFRVSEPAVAAIERVPAAEYVPKTTASAAAGPVPAGAGDPRSVRDGYSVTVSAWVAENEPEASMARRYFRIPVVFTPTGARASSVPAPVAAPTAGGKVENAYSASADRSHPMVVSAQQFLNAMVAGTGEIGRYTSPGVVIDPIDPPIASAVEIETVAATEDLPPASETVTDGQSARILLTVQLRDQQQRPGMSAQYALTMKARAGRWEVAAMDPVPQVRAPSPSAVAGTASQGQSGPSSSSAQIPASSTPTAPATP